MPQASFFAARKELLLSLPLLAAAVIAIVQIWSFPVSARLFPLSVAIVMVVAGVAQVGKDLLGRSSASRPATPPPAAVAEPKPKPEVEGPAAATRAQNIHAALWFVGFFVALWALGFLVAVPLYTFVYLQFESREKIWWSALGAAAAWAFLYLLFVQALPVPLLKGELLQILGVS